MWDEEDVAFEENTQVFKRRGQADAQLPPEKPILLLNRLEEALEVVEVVEIQTRRPPPPRRHLPEPPSPSLVDATPTRPGAHGYTNEILFAAPVVVPAQPVAVVPTLEEDERSSISLEPAIMEPWLGPKKRKSRRLEIGAAAAVLLAAVSYLHGPFESDPPGRASVRVRTGEVIAAQAAPESGVGAATSDAPPHARQRRPGRGRAPLLEADSAALPEEAEAAATDTESTANPAEASDRAPSAEVSDQLTQALAPEFNVGAAKAAVAVASGNASACGDGSATGSARVSVTFANSGRATVAVVDGASPLAGTSVGSCVARALQQASVPTYSGKIVTVVTRVTVR